MVLGRSVLGHGEVLDHGTTRSGRWLRARRVRIAAWIALLEGLLVVVHVLPRLPVFAVAAIAILVYLSVGRGARSDLLRQASWIAAASQALAVLVPVLLIVVTWAAVTAVVILAVVALIALFADKR